MLQFLNPIWLLAIGAIIIPLAIHLWNVKKGRTLKIGSIQLLGQSSKQISRSLRLQDLWLLLLRCLLLITLSVLLAAPFITRKLAAEKIKGWVLMDKDHLQETYQSFKPTIDSLLKLGYETHYFNPGFVKFDLTDTAEYARDDHMNSVPHLSYWSLARALDEQVPPNVSAYIFTENRLNRFVGSRPFLKSKVTWKTYNSPDSVFNKIDGAYLTRRDSLKVILAQSTPRGITYASENTSIKDLNPAYELASADRTAIRFNSSGGLKNQMDSSSVKIDTSTLYIALYTDKHRADLAYVKAALEAVQSVSQRRISIEIYLDEDKVPNGLNWVFWLSETPLTEQVKNRAENVLNYQPGKTLTPDNARLITENTSFNLTDTRLYKRKDIINQAEEDLLWEDESGNPILSRSAGKGITEYKFFSRFDPEWNDLVLEPRFPEAMLELLFEPNDRTSGLALYDKRTMPLSQIAPVSIKQSSPLAKDMRFEETHLDKYLWAFFALLLALERWMSHKQKPITANG